MIDWVELDAGRCEILNKFPHTDGGLSVKIRHPNAGRPKLFLKSKNGNWYWLPPKPKFSGELRKGYVIKDLGVVIE